MHKGTDVAYNFCMRRTVWTAAVSATLGMAAVLSGCVTTLPGLAENNEIATPTVIGRTVTILTGERGRRYEPKVRFFEVENQDTNQRFNVEVDAQDQYFALSLPPGDYRLNRVQISEGPFMSMADLTSTFSVGQQPLTYVGTWRFGVDSPRYGRMVALSIILTAEESSGIKEFLRDQYPELEEQPMVDVLPQPSQVSTRLYEVMPYPRYPRYFRRHWW
jgi:hypothetical protein